MAMLQVYVPNVSSVSFVSNICCNCFIWVLQKVDLDCYMLQWLRCKCMF
jgi:hypothetical protein